MCGIAGVYHYAEPLRPVDVHTLRAMTDSLAHRGPDGEGIWSDAGVGLGHRRLAIIDLSDNGRQPMVSGSGRTLITFNGEIYTFRELREQLKGAGFAFRTATDTEVILAGYEHFGPDVVDHLSGIFAFAIWDFAERRLFIARDPIGIKPLFYSDDGRTFRFGSEIKALLTDPSVGREPDVEAIDAMLTFNYTPAPLTGFASVRQLLPGHCAFVSGDGLSVRRYWTTPYAPQPSNIDFAAAVGEFTERFDRVVRAQMVSDVPLGCFLSGGLDSAAIARGMKRASPDGVRALTVGFRTPTFDEREAARRTAADLHISLHEQELSLDAAALLPALSRHMEEPTADSSMLPVYLLCKAAREIFTVAMSGDGADEILAGYETYRATTLASRYRRLPRWLRAGLIGPLAGRLPVSDRKYGLQQLATRFVAGAEMGAGRDHCAWRMIFGDDLKRRSYSQDFLEGARSFDPIARYLAHVNAVPTSREPLAGLLNADTEFYLPNDMLVKVDRMSMAHGLEVRVPFLDIEIVRFCANLPAEFKLHRGRRRKHLLRESLRGTISPTTLDCPKSGFNLPVEEWMRGPLADLLTDAVATRKHELGRFLQVDAIEQMRDEHRSRRADHAHALFGVLMLSLWLDNAATCWKTVAKL